MNIWGSKTGLRSDNLSPRFQVIIGASPVQICLDNLPVCLTELQFEAKYAHVVILCNWVSPKLQLSSIIWQNCLIYLILLLIIAKLKNDKMYGSYMVTHLGNILGLDSLTSVNWPFTLSAFTFGSCLYCANVSYCKDGWTVN